MMALSPLRGGVSPLAPAEAHLERVSEPYPGHRGQRTARDSEDVQTKELRKAISLAQASGADAKGVSQQPGREFVGSQDDDKRASGGGVKKRWIPNTTPSESEEEDESDEEGGADGQGGEFMTSEEEEYDEGDYLEDEDSCEATIEQRKGNTSMRDKTLDTTAGEMDSWENSVICFDSFYLLLLCVLCSASLHLKLLLSHPLYFLLSYLS